MWTPQKCHGKTALSDARWRGRGLPCGGLFVSSPARCGAVRPRISVKPRRAHPGARDTLDDTLRAHQLRWGVRDLLGSDNPGSNGGSPRVAHRGLPAGCGQRRAASSSGPTGLPRAPSRELTPSLAAGHAKQTSIVVRSSEQAEGKPSGWHLQLPQVHGGYIIYNGIQHSGAPQTS